MKARLSVDDLVCSITQDLIYFRTESSHNLVRVYHYKILDKMNATLANTANADLSFKTLSYASLVGIPICVIGLVANSFILYLFITDGDFNKSTYHFLRVSVVSDIICAVAAFSGYLHTASHRLGYDGGTLMCRIIIYFALTSYCVSMMNLCLIGLDRYYNIKGLPSVYRCNKKCVFIVGEVFILLIAASVTSPTLIYVQVHHNATLLCDFPDMTPSVSMYLIAFTMIGYVIPAILIIVIYWKIIFLQRNYIQPIDRLSSFREENRLSKKRYVKMLLSISLSYILLTWPSFATFLGLAITGQSLMDIRSKSIVLFLLSFLSSGATISIVVLNPFIYLKFDKLIRYKAMMGIKCLLPDAWTRQRNSTNYHSAISNSYHVKIEATVTS